MCEDNTNEFAQKPKNIFYNKNFLLLFIGRMVSDMGDAIFNVAVGWYILSITQSGIQMSIYMATGTIVYMIAGPFGGVIADRFNRQHMIIWTDLLRAILLTIVSALLFMNISSILIFYLSASLLSIFGAFFVPASNAIIPKIVRKDQLSKANSTTSLSSSISNLIGVSAAGMLYAIIGIKGISLVNALSFFICAVLMILIKTVKESFPKNNIIDKNFRKHIFIEMKEGFLYLKNIKSIFLLICFFALNNLITIPMFTVYIPYIFNVILKASVSSYAMFQVAMTLGSMGGALLFGILPQQKKFYSTFKIIFFAGSMLFLCASAFFYFYTTGFITKSILIGIFIFLGFFGGIIFTTINIPLNVVVQKSISNEFLGRVSSLVSTISMIAMPIGMIIGGGTADLIPMKYLVFSIGIIYLITAIVFTKIKILREV